MIAPWSAAGDGSDQLVSGYDLVIFDLDGVIYLIDQPIPGVVATVDRLLTTDIPIAYATNNASRRAAEVADLLTGMGVPATETQVLTSAGAAASLLAERFAPGDRVLVVGAEALRREVANVGLVPVSAAADRPVAVVQGYGPEVGWADLAEATVAVRSGSVWVATNTDRTLPSVRGPLPGNGSLVAALRTALDREPDEVVGKPAPALFTAAARRVGAIRPLVVGDRLDTDIEGANRAGLDSLMVLTGISGPRDLLTACPRRRPTYLAHDVSGLFGPAGMMRILPVADAAPDLGGWHVERDGDRLVLDGDGDGVNALRALCGMAWTGGGSVIAVIAGSGGAETVLRELDLHESVGPRRLGTTPGVQDSE